MSLYKGNNLISGHQVLYSTTGSNADGAMTQKAATDNFANVTLSNLSSTASKNIDGQYIANVQTLSSATAVGEYSIDLSSYLPNDGYNYMIYGYFYGISSGFCWCDIRSSIQSSWLRLAVTNNTYDTSDFVIPIGTNRTLTYSIANAALAASALVMVGYRRIGTNS